jgi:hypothetical protein
VKENNVIAFHKPEQVEDTLTELPRTGAKRLIGQAVEAELAELLSSYSGQTDAEGRAAVGAMVTYRNGKCSRGWAQWR